ncbi:MAG: DUF695 domain-containing protein [Bacteroidota bacterium]
MSFFKKLFQKEPAKTIQTNEEFWAWFVEREQAFFSAVQAGTSIREDFVQPVYEKLNELRHECYSLLVGRSNEEQVHFIISAEGVVKNFVFAEDLIHEAPALENWKFTALKPAIDIQDTGIRMAEVEFTKEKIKFYPQEVEGYPDLIALKITHADFTEEQKDLISNGVYIYLDHLLGERNFTSIVDQIEVVSEASIQEQLVPIEKITDYLTWRQKEFVEKYKGHRSATEEDEHTVFESSLRSGNTAFATLNTELLRWDSKASHPWMLTIKIEYDTKRDDGLPDEGVQEELDRLEDLFREELKDSEGYLNIGRETGDWLREIYFACQETDWCSRKVDEIIRAYEGAFKLEYDMHKDKYWKSLERYDVE